MGRHAVFPRPFARTAAGTGSDPPARAFFEPPDARVETLRQPALPVLRTGASALILEYMSAVVASRRARERLLRFEFCSDAAGGR